MHAAFTGEHAVGVFAFDLYRGGFDACFFTRGGIENRGAETFLLGPAQIHAQEHFGPVLRFGAAGAGFHSDDGVEAIVFTGQQGFGFKFGEIGVRRCQFFGDVFEKRITLGVVFFFLGEAEVRFDVAFFSIEGRFRVYAVFDLFALLQRFLGLGLILPKIRVAGFCF